MKRILRTVVLVAACLGGATAWAAEAESAEKVNINTADAAALSASLKGVGAAKAEAIVAWREEHGPFQAAAQLTEVRGIGDALVEANRDKIAVE